MRALLGVRQLRRPPVLPVQALVENELLQLELLWERLRQWPRLQPVRWASDVRPGLPATEAGLPALPEAGLSTVSEAGLPAVPEAGPGLPAVSEAGPGLPTVPEAGPGVQPVPED